MNRLPLMLFFLRKKDQYRAFSSFSYKDSSNKAMESLFLKQKSVLSNVSVGSTIKFGVYEQDNVTSNGKEEIEWVVLAVDDRNALIISKYALDCQQYNTMNDTTWETSSLRTWLNGAFYDAAFGANHQQMIQSTTLTADENPPYGTSPGNNTTDKVFLLGITEANKYFSTDEAGKCAMTYYTIVQGAVNRGYSTEGKAVCRWWLRSPGYLSDRAAFVNSNGAVNYEGYAVNLSDVAVRPVLWINTDF